jgi:peptide chain release factor 1
MKDSIRNRLRQLAERYEEITFLLAEPDVFSDVNRFRDLSREFSQLEPLVTSWRSWESTMLAVEDARAMLDEPDKALRQMAEEEFRSKNTMAENLDREIQLLLLPTDPKDECNIFLEIRAGTGGDEAALFAGNLFRMYQKYAEAKGWNTEVISQSPGEHGGFKEIIVLMEGRGAYSRMKFESGTHRVQRVPETESQGRIHTSACTVAILPETESIEAIHINPADLRIDTYRSSGAGGQHVNKTDSAIRITHLPSGMVVECQEERSQHKNKARAMSLLQAKLLAQEQEKQISETAASRRLQVGSGDRSQRIRTYNYPQGRLTDHRIELTLYKLEEVLSGNLDLVIEPLLHEHQAELLSEIGS